MNLSAKFQRFRPLRYKTVSYGQTREIGPLAAMPQGFFPTNPSVLRTADSTLLCIRGVNYRLERSKFSVHPVFTIGNTYKSINRFIVESGPNARVSLPRLDMLFEGAEDVRLFTHEGAPWCVFSRSSGAGGRKMVLAQLDLAAQTADFLDLESPFGLTVEKNWTPFSRNGTIYMIYSFAPLIVIAVDTSNGEVSVTHSDLSASDTTQLSFVVGGSSGGFRHGSDLLFLTHRRSVRLPGMKRIYVHSCARLSGDFSRVIFGPAFVMRASEIQFVAGFIEDGSNFEISIGRRDCEAHLWTVPRDRFGRDLIPNWP